MSVKTYTWGAALFIVGLVMAIIAREAPMHPNPQLALLILAAIIGGSGIIIMAVLIYGILRR